MHYYSLNFAGAHDQSPPFADYSKVFGDLCSPLPSHADYFATGAFDFGEEWRFYPQDFQSRYTSSLKSCTTPEINMDSGGWWPSLRQACESATPALVSSPPRSPSPQPLPQPATPHLHQSPRNLLRHQITQRERDDSSDSELEAEEELSGDEYFPEPPAPPKCARAQSEGMRDAQNLPILSSADYAFYATYSSPSSPSPSHAKGISPRRYPGRKAARPSSYKTPKSRNIQVSGASRFDSYRCRRTCDHCPWVQMNCRLIDLKRHNTTHFRQYGLHVYRGVRSADAGDTNISDDLTTPTLYHGELWVGGCGLDVSRRDALIRHLRNSTKGCAYHADDVPNKRSCK